MPEFPPPTADSLLADMRERAEKRVVRESETLRGLEEHCTQVLAEAQQNVAEAKQHLDNVNRLTVT